MFKKKISQPQHSGMYSASRVSASHVSQGRFIRHADQMPMVNKVKQLGSETRESAPCCMLGPQASPAAREGCGPHLSFSKCPRRKSEMSFSAASALGMMG